MVGRIRTAITMRRLFVVLLSIVVVALANEQRDVVAPVGKIRGTTLTSRLGKKIYSFLGVRYAEPPTGQRRFQPPVPAADWNDDVFDASVEGPSCPGIGAQNMSEDCLRLNVYTTELPQSTDKPVKKPVLVFFHPGGFYTSAGLSAYFGPQYLLDRDVVLVTVNYRLGTLGFLSTGDSKAPGNMGLKDQVIALRWIRRNIAAFGGDPDCVTITGYSAGGVSALLHMVSPMTKDLFHRVIMMSGSTAPDPFPTNQSHLAKKQAELLGCPTDTTGAMLVCLISKPVEDFTNTMTKFFEWHDNPILVWSPVVEPEVHGVERFLPDDPLELIKQGKFHKVPLIAGVTKDEFGSAVVDFNKQHQLGNDSMFDDLNNDWYRLAPICYLYERDTPRSRNISEQLYQFYFGNQTISPNTYDGLAQIYADSVIIYPMQRVIKLLAENSDQSVYSYVFTYQGRFSFAMWNDTSPYGVVHHDDLQYLYFISVIFPFYKDDAPEVPIVELMTDMWSNFAQTGQPISPALASNFTWEPYRPELENYLEISEEPKMKTKLYPDRMKIWERLFS